jgi:predicted protein tyrosine phosphatase
LRQVIDMQLFICGTTELEQYASVGINHLITIHDPGEKPIPIRWVDQDNSYTFAFYDTDDPESHIQSPDDTIVNSIIALGEKWKRDVQENPHFKLLIQCNGGLSRSPAVAYVLMNLWRGSGYEKEILLSLSSIRSNMFPNEQVVKLADKQLGRNGLMVKALSEYMQKRRSSSWFDLTE